MGRFTLVAGRVVGSLKLQVDSLYIAGRFTLITGRFAIFVGRVAIRIGRSDLRYLQVGTAVVAIHTVVGRSIHDTHVDYASYIRRSFHFAVQRSPYRGF